MLISEKLMIYPGIVAFLLILTGFVLFFSEFKSKHQRKRESDPRQLKTELHERVFRDTKKRNKEWGSPALPRGN